MKKFFSISQYPGKTGQHYYTKFFKIHNLDYVYEPLGSNNLKSTLELVLKENVSGISISMPFKKEILNYLDEQSELVSQYSCCNTVLIKNRKLIGYNTDWYGAKHVLSLIPKNSNIYILGDGMMGTMIYNMLDQRATIISRKKNNWDLKDSINGTLINCTGLGTISFDSPFEKIPNLDCVIDLSIKSNQLEEQCKSVNIKYVKGIDFYKYQFQKQFEIYTGIQPNLEYF